LHKAQTEPWILICDFTLVTGIDSSAAQAIAKLKDNLSKSFNVETLCYVSGSDVGFPCEFDLTTELSDHDSAFYCGSHVFETLDAALMFAEDALIYRQDPSLMGNSLRMGPSLSQGSLDEHTCEQDIAFQYLRNIIPHNPKEEDARELFRLFEREEYGRDDFVWVQGSPGDSVKLVVSGVLIAIIEHEAGTVDPIPVGNTIGEMGLVYGTQRLSSVKCVSDSAVLYSLSRESYESLIEQNPKLARMIDLICVKYLACRVQHVSNRIFETRCLPI